jgi:hypothetical protein
MELFIRPDGRIRALYGEEVPLDTLGTLSIKRASFVEPDAAGGWLVDLAPVGGPVLGPFCRRSQGLEAEKDWLLANHLSAPGTDPALYPMLSYGQLQGLVAFRG